MNQAQLQRVNRTQWIPMLILRALGYSSFVAAVFSMIFHWYKKQSNTRLQPKSMEKEIISMKPKLKVNTSKELKRSRDTFLNLSSSQQLFTPPSSSFSIPSNSLKSRTTSPLSNWSSKILDGVMFSLMKRKKLTISLKNTILWNPSSDLNTPNHAFHENAALFLTKLAILYDIYVIIHMNSDQEHHQIQQLLNNAHLIDPTLIDERKILYCNSERGKVHLINHINPSIHIEGGCENDNGFQVIQNLNAPSVIWVLPMDSHQLYSHLSVEITHHILHTSLAEQLGA